MRGLINTKYSDWIIAAVFALTIFVQCVLFHYLIYKEILFSSLWNSPLQFVRFYLPHLTVALFCSSFVFLFKQKWWTIIVSLLFNIWILANLWYYRANDIFLDHYTVCLIGNMAGFWDSILALIYPIDFIFISLTLTLSIFIIILKKKDPRIHSFVIIFFTSIICGILNGVLLVKKHDNDLTYMNPILETEYEYYLQDHSIIHYALLTTKGIIKLRNEEQYTMTQQDNHNISRFLNKKSIYNKPSTPLIICIIESFNSFVLTDTFMPNLQKFINNNNNIIYVPHIISQEKNAHSADGQMIIQAGILPVSKGATCMRFPFNKYPSISSLYSRSVGLFPHKLNCWNQKMMSPAYKIDTSIVASTNDTILFSLTIDLSKKYNNIMMLTIASHLPCKQYANYSSLPFSDSIPILMQNYIKSLNVTDKAMNLLFDKIETNDSLSMATIVITGDHKLPISQINDFDNLYNYNTFIPLIIYSPEIKQKTIITDTCYQMDIYPTILHLIGCEDYYWKGFGVNLLDSVARHNRPITPEEAYDLSDKMIRADFFRKFEE